MRLGKVVSELIFAVGAFGILFSKNFAFSLYSSLKNVFQSKIMFSKASH